jgi:hypothetical protein
MTATEEPTTARALAGGAALTARQAALVVDVPLPDDGLIAEVPLEVDTLALAAKAAAYLLSIFQKDAMVATEGSPAVLAGASGRTGAAPGEPP